MKTPNMRRTLSAVLTGLALAAMTQVSFAVPQVATESQIAAVTALATTMAEPRSTGRPPVTLYMEGPSGNPFRLIHVQDAGWKYADGWKSFDRGAWLFRTTAFGSKTPALAAKVVPDDEPLTVFIDGPSGFTYVWNRDDGWKFVGKIADRR